MRSACIAFLSALTFLASSCVEIPKYDNAPAILFAGIDKFDAADLIGNKTERVRITISFEDGDGDLGENRQDEARMKLLTDNGDWGNYQIKAYQQVGQAWEEYPMPESRFAVFPVLKTDGKKGPIRGKLDFDMDFYPLSGTKQIPMKFVVKIRDRALRESNFIETDLISIPAFDIF